MKRQPKLREVKNLTQYEGKYKLRHCGLFAVRKFYKIKNSKTKRCVYELSMTIIILTIFLLAIKQGLTSKADNLTCTPHYFPFLSGTLVWFTFRVEKLDFRSH